MSRRMISGLVMTCVLLFETQVGVAHAQPVVTYTNVTPADQSTGVLQPISVGCSAQITFNPNNQTLSNVTVTAVAQTFPTRGASNYNISFTPVNQTTGSISGTVTFNAALGAGTVVFMTFQAVDSNGINMGAGKSISFSVK